MSKCITPGCTNDVTCPSFNLCGCCYNSMLRWSKRSKVDQQVRIDKLRLWESRFDAILPSSQTKPKFKRLEKPLDVIPGQLMKKRQRTKN